MGEADVATEMTGRDWQRVEWLMGKLADANSDSSFGCILGRRSADRGTPWYCRVGGVEYDGLTPLDALQSAFDYLRQDLQHQVREAEAEARRQRATLDALAEGVPVS